MASPPSEKLLSLAKGQLGYPPNARASSVPTSYLDELKLHLLLYPDDINFRMTLEPQVGFGKLTCLEQGCNGLIVPLCQSFKVPDGGKRYGHGSLSAYRYHITDHPTHAKNRHARVKAAQAIKEEAVATPIGTPVAVKTEPSNLLNLLDSGSNFPSTSRSSDGGLRPIKTIPGRISSLVRVKPEPLDSELPNRRLSDITFGALKRHDDGSFPLEPDPKKHKVDVKTPLALVNRNTASLETIDISPPFPVSKAASSVEDIRAKINHIQSRLASYQASLDRITRKKRKNKLDTRNMKFYTDEILRLRREKDGLNASIPSMSPNKRTMSKPLIPHLVKAESSFTNLELPPPFHNPLYGRMPIVHQPQPTASGSNYRLPTPRERFDMNTDEDDGDEDFNPDLATAVLQRIGSIIPALPALPGSEHHDRNGDFYGRGRDLFVGPQAKADDIDKFLLEAGNAEQFDGNASVEQALEKLGLQSQYDLLPGMEVALMPHQTIGVAWMVEKEQSSLQGGCLGDDMGLGKTIQMIAVLLKNRSEDPICKTNLIIAPTALLDQWKMEIEMKTNCDLKVLIYHGSSKPRRKKDLLTYDVVVTTYSTMALEWPDLEAEQKKKLKAKRQKNAIPDTSDDSDDLAPSTKRKRESGLLFQVDFHRIILDEAQSIRNRRTRTSRAVTDLRARYRWCLTGTPIINSLVDVYGYLRFLRIRPWYDFTKFQDHIGALEKKNPTLAVSRLQAVITTFLLRRMKDSMLDGKHLIELPGKEISLVKLEFSEEEREIYKMVEARTQANFNSFLRAGTVLKNYSQVLVLLLRLRQICSHPSLIQEGGAAFASPGGAEDVSSPVLSTELTRARRLVSPEFVAKMKLKFKTLALQRIAAEKESFDAVVEDEECPICFDVLTDAVITPCTHVFCRDCLVDVLGTPLAGAGDEPAKFKPGERPCPSCRSPICVTKLFTRTAFMPSDADLLLDDQKPQVNLDNDVKMEDNFQGKGKGKAKARNPTCARKIVLDSDDPMGSGADSDGDDGDNTSDYNIDSDEDEEEKGLRRILKKRLGKRKAVVLDSDDEIEDSREEKEVLFGAKRASTASGDTVKVLTRFLPSTKMKFMMEQLCKLANERPEEKTLIVSQWTGCLSLVSDYLTEAGIIHVKYQGDMNRTKRDQAVRVFMSKDKARVMLMSLKCGGVGLNLTRANNVISLDLGWSQAVEAQSFDRVHRLGQTRPVVVQRLVISDTVEDRVLTMQERKQTIADGSLGEGSGKKIGRLSVKELANLFGLDHRGRLLTNN